MNFWDLSTCPTVTNLKKDSSSFKDIKIPMMICPKMKMESFMDFNTSSVTIFLRNLLHSIMDLPYKMQMKSKEQLLNARKCMTKLYLNVSMKL